MVPCTWRDLLPFAAMVMVEITDVGAATISKAAMSKGMNSYVLVVYSSALGTIFLLPGFILQKKVSLTSSLLGGQFLLGLIGSSSLLLAYNGINYSSPTLASAIGNLIPIFTFMLAIIFRMDKLDLRRSSSRAKVLGTIVSASGAFIIILYKGSVIFSPSNSPDQDFMMISQQSKWILGGVMLAVACLLAAAWNIVQTLLVENCQSKVTIVFFYTFFVTIQCTVFSLFVERNWNAWLLRPDIGRYYSPDIKMISIVFKAIFGSVLRIGVDTWCLHQKGPIFVAMFKPLGIAIAAVLPRRFSSPCVIGSIIIAIGFYAVMWALIKEKSTAPMESDVQSLASSTKKTPFLEKMHDNKELSLIHLL